MFPRQHKAIVHQLAPTNFEAALIDVRWPTFDVSDTFAIVEDECKGLYVALAWVKSRFSGRRVQISVQKEEKLVADEMERNNLGVVKLKKPVHHVARLPKAVRYLSQFL